MEKIKNKAIGVAVLAALVLIVVNFVADYYGDAAAFSLIALAVFFLLCRKGRRRFFGAIQAIQDCEAYVSAGSKAIDKSIPERDAGRVPLFWDHMERAEDMIQEAQHCHNLAVDLAAKHNGSVILRPMSLKPDMIDVDPGLGPRLEAVRSKWKTQLDEALSEEKYFQVYENRREAKAILASQEKLQEGIDAAREEAARATKAASAAKSAASAAEHASRWR